MARKRGCLDYVEVNPKLPVRLLYGGLTKSPEKTSLSRLAPSTAALEPLLMVVLRKVYMEATSFLRCQPE
jgi:hypothetical protein